MTVRSAGLLLYRRAPAGLECLLAHPGGPFWVNKDQGCWSIPKGEAEPGEDDATVARREFSEEIGQAPPPGEWIELGEVRLRSGKVVVAFALEGSLDASVVVSNTFEMEWPPRSGHRVAFPEIDRAEWFEIEAARAKITQSQLPLLDRLATAVGI